MSKRLEDRFNEYHLRIEEVLSGMDSVLVQLNNRVGRLEKQVTRLLRDRAVDGAAGSRSNAIDRVRTRRPSDHNSPD
ncbi:MAG: hypothetical protein ACREVE_04115 [Gammaproteobacteria bacterium]